MLDHVIKLIIATWEGEPKSFSGNMMNGLARLLYAYGENIKDNIFKDKLGEISGQSFLVWGEHMSVLPG